MGIILPRMTRLTVFAIITTLVALYVVFLPVFWTAAFGKMLFYPDKQGYQITSDLDYLEKQYQVRCEDVKIPTANGQTLNGWLFRLPSSKKIALVSHGNAGNICYRLPLAATLLAAGVSVLLYDYEGYGESSGKPSLVNICD